MALREDFERSGIWLFRWRSYLPIFLIGILLIGFRHFSYPFGRHESRVRRAVERAGYCLACTSRYGLNRSRQSYAVRRTEVTGTDTLADFRRKLRGKYDWLGYWKA